MSVRLVLAGVPGMFTVSVVGIGYVGLVTGVCFVNLGKGVICIDVDVAKVASLRVGVLRINEPRLEELVERDVRAARLSFTTSYEEGLHGTDFVSVNMPPGRCGEAGLTYTRADAPSIAKQLADPA